MKNNYDKFIVLTRVDGSPAILRYDRIKGMKRTSEGCDITYDSGMVFNVAETPAEVEEKIKWNKCRTKAQKAARNVK